MALSEGDIALLLHLAELLGKGGPFHIEVVSELLAAERDVEGTALVLDGFGIEVCHHALSDALRCNEEAPAGEYQVLLGCIDKKASSKLCCPPFLERPVRCPMARSMAGRDLLLHPKA